MIPRAEYPRMQFRREDSWINLNGSWEFQPDPCQIGFQRGFFLPGQEFSRQITVPFCMESVLSGVNIRDPYRAVWYRRQIEVPQGWQGKKILLHIGGADYLTTVWIDGCQAGRHIGGSCSWTLDITAFVSPGGTHQLTFCCEDDISTGLQPAGKQSDRYDSYGCLFTRVTGIYGTVWLEAVAPEGLSSIRTCTDIADGTLTVVPEFFTFSPDCRLTAQLFKEGKLTAASECSCRPGACLTLQDANHRRWSPADPFLYDLRLQVRSGDKVLDTVESYVGFREIRISGNRIFLNDEPICLRFVLDQGYYPEGVWTAPDDESLQRDIRLGLECGFNGARLHQRVFDERFLYWADRMGYLVVGEMPDWRMELTNPEACRRFTSEFREMIRRDRNHPSIIFWTPLNETFHNPAFRQEAQFPFKRFGQYDPMVHTAAYRDFAASLHALAKEADPTRPFHDASGGIHADTDIRSRHLYAADIEEFTSQLGPGKELQEHALSVPCAGQPFWVDEFGMINAAQNNLPDIALQIGLMNGDPRCCGWCFTQLYDVEQEQNGIFRYDRSAKFDSCAVRKVFSQKPEWSKY